jgi:hypothetical protein
MCCAQELTLVQMAQLVERYRMTSVLRTTSQALGVVSVRTAIGASAGQELEMLLSPPQQPPQQQQQPAATTAAAAATAATPAAAKQKRAPRQPKQAGAAATPGAPPGTRSATTAAASGTSNSSSSSLTPADSSSSSSSAAPAAIGSSVGPAASSSSGSAAVDVAGTLLGSQQVLQVLGAAAAHAVTNHTALHSARQQLPYRLTGDQEAVLSVILDDMRGPKAMLRLLQGDVGCGKTVVALLACLAAAGSGACVCVRGLS